MLSSISSFSSSASITVCSRRFSSFSSSIRSLKTSMIDTENGACYGVLDLDSFERSAFSEHDLLNLRRLMESTGLSWPAPHLPALVY